MKILLLLIGLLATSVAANVRVTDVNILWSTQVVSGRVLVTFLDTASKGVLGRAVQDGRWVDVSGPSHPENVGQFQVASVDSPNQIKLWVPARPLHNQFDEEGQTVTLNAVVAECPPPTTNAPVPFAFINKTCIKEWSTPQAGVLVLGFDAVSDHRYQLQLATTLNPPVQWFAYQTYYHDATNSRAYLEVNLGTSPRTTFFRVLHD